MTHQKFIEKYKGTFIDFDGRFGFQCMDLMRKYVKEVHGFNPYTAIPAAETAKKCFNNFKTNKYYTKIPNSKTNVPKKGDIVFWGYYPTVTGLAGHVDIFDDGDLYTIVSFSQNYPTGRPCEMVRHGKNKILHGYRGVMGWLRKNE